MCCLSFQRDITVPLIVTTFREKHQKGYFYLLLLRKLGVKIKGHFDLFESCKWSISRFYIVSVQSVSTCAIMEREGSSASHVSAVNMYIWKIFSKQAAMCKIYRTCHERTAAAEVQTSRCILKNPDGGMWEAFFPIWRVPAGLSCWCHQLLKQHFTQ